MRGEPDRALACLGAASLVAAPSVVAKEVVLVEKGNGEDGDRLVAVTRRQRGKVCLHQQNLGTDQGHGTNRERYIIEEAGYRQEGREEGRRAR